MTSSEHLQRASKILGSQSALADLCQVSKAAVSQWKEPGRRVPAEYCPLIEEATKGQVTCEELRPDVKWQYLRALRTAVPATNEQQPFSELPVSVQRGVIAGEG